MSTSNRIDRAPEILDFYSKRLKDFGNTSQGVGWKDDYAQLVRFDQLLKIIKSNNNFSINDLGCGSGRLYKYLRSKNCAPSAYRGYDILDEMLLSPEQSLMPDSKVILSKIESVNDMSLSDYSVASGTFNVKGETTEQDWLTPYPFGNYLDE